MNSIVYLFKAIADSPDEQTLHNEIVPEIGEYFAAKRCRLFILAQLPRQASGLCEQTRRSIKD